MATWTTNTTTTDDAEATPLQKARDKILGVGWTLIKILFVMFLIMAEFCSVPKLEDTRSNPSDIREEMDSLIRSGTTRELELDNDDNADLTLYNTMMTLVTNMRFGDFELEGAKAQEFWAAYAPEKKSDTTLDYIRFQSAERRVLLRYSNGIASEITMEFDDRYLSKTVVLNYGIFNGKILSWIGWKLVGRFAFGYPCYVTEANMNGNGINGDVTIRKFTIRNQVFSWSFSPGKRRQIENITGHWVTREASV